MATNKKIAQATITFHDETFHLYVKDAADKDKVTIGVLAKRCMASVLHLELPTVEQHTMFGTVGKYSHIIGKNKVREQNLRNLTQYILDNWQDMPDNIKSQVIANQ